MSEKKEKRMTDAEYASLLEQTLIRMFDNINGDIGTIKRGVSYKFINTHEEEDKLYRTTVYVKAAGYGEKALQEIRIPVKKSSAKGVAEARATAIQMLLQAMIETSLLHWDMVGKALGSDIVFQKAAIETTK